MDKFKTSIAQVSTDLGGTCPLIIFVVDWQIQFVHINYLLIHVEEESKFYFYVDRTLR